MTRRIPPLGLSDDSGRLERGSHEGATATDREADAGLERIERDAWLDFFAAAPAGTVEALQLGHRRIGPYGLLASRVVAITEFNRAVGFGIGIEAGPAAPAGDLAEAVRWLRANAGAVWALQIPPSRRTEPVLAWCREQGLAPSGPGWAKFRLDARLSAARRTVASTTVLEILSVDAGSAAAFGRTVQAGFDLPPATAAWFAVLVGRPGWLAYLAYEGGEPVAAGVMFARDGAAWLGMDATLPRFRERGAQASLIARRVRDGLERGMSSFTAETGYPEDAAVPAAASFRNYGRASFALIHRRSNYAAQVSGNDPRQA